MRSPAPQVAFVLAVALAAAGCLNFGGASRHDFERTQDEVYQAALPALEVEHASELGHYDAAAHNGSWNLELVGYHNGIDGSGNPNNIPALGSYTEIAITQDYAYLSRMSSDGSFGGFSILDIRNPANPLFLGKFNALPGADIEVNSDQTLAFFATQRNEPPQIMGAVATNQDARAGLPRGIYVVNIEDKTAPVLESFVALPSNGPHTITYYAHRNGNEYVVTCTYDLMRDPVTGGITGVNPLTQRVIVFQVVTNPVSDIPLPGPRTTLMPVAQYQYSEPGPAPAGKLYFPHDTRIQDHPSDNRTLMYVAYWDKGMRILDFSHPPAYGMAMEPGATPMLPEVQSFTEFAPSALNNIHLVQPFDAPIADRHVTVAEPELIVAPDETGQITFIDTTDLTRTPVKLGHWTLPAQADLGVNNFDFSPHNFDLWDGKVALAHYHAGVWVLDVSDEENLKEPKATAFYMPNKPRAASPVMQPTVWGVFEQKDAQGDSYLFVSDEATGLYVLRYVGPGA